MRTLVLGLGNELLSDDAVGILAARELKDKVNGGAEVIESNMSGLSLLDLFLGYERAIVIDAVCTSRAAPGSIHELTPSDLGAVVAPSPHYTGLPEMLALADQLDLEFPHEIKIFALEVQDPYTLGGDLSPAVRSALPSLVGRVLLQLSCWKRA